MLKNKRKEKSRATWTAFKIILISTSTQRSTSFVKLRDRRDREHRIIAPLSLAASSTARTQCVTVDARCTRRVRDTCSKIETWLGCGRRRITDSTVGNNVNIRATTKQLIVQRVETGTGCAEKNSIRNIVAGMLCPVLRIFHNESSIGLSFFANFLRISLGS